MSAGWLARNHDSTSRRSCRASANISATSASDTATGASYETRLRLRLKPSNFRTNGASAPKVCSMDSSVIAWWPGALEFVR